MPESMFIQLDSQGFTSIDEFNYFPGSLCYLFTMWPPFRCYEVDWTTQVLELNDDFVVLDKPAGVPVKIFGFLIFVSTE